MKVKKAIEEINKLGSLSKKLEYYNNNFWPPIQVGFYFEPEGFKIDGEKHELFCLCDQCKDKGLISDFETYRDIRNKTTRLIERFFRITKDYKTKVEYYFEISQDCGTTMFPLFSVPDKLEDFVNKDFYNKEFECKIDITPKDINEIVILKKYLKNRLLFDKSKLFLSQFTFEKRVENLEKLLKNKIDKESRNDIFRVEYDKIRKSKINRDSKKTFDKTIFKILVVAERISQEKHNEFYSSIFDIEITILAEDTSNYEEYLNDLQEENKKQFGNNKEISNIQPDDKYLNEIWFKVGLLFAKGELNEYYNSNRKGFKEGYSAPIVAKELECLKFEKNILATINNYSSNKSSGSKNIFNSQDKMNKIIKYCNENQITIDDYFLSRLHKE
jgi:hypothetical protein